MPKFEWQAPDGQRWSAEGDTIEEAFAKIDVARGSQPQPPPGVIIHGPKQSYVTGPINADPLVRQTQSGNYEIAPRGTGLRVDTDAMRAGTVSPALRNAPSDPATLESLRSDFRAQLPPGTNISDLPRLPDDARSRDEAAVALQMRRDSPIASLLGPLSPLFQGVSQNLGDEAVSAARGVTAAATGGNFRSSYNLAQEAQRQALEQERADRPTTSAVSQLGGALTLAPALGASMPAAGAAPGAGALSPAARIGIGTGYGGLLGAAEGAGAGTTPQERLTGAREGGLFGAIFGAATPIVADIARRLTTRGLDRATIDRTAKELGVSREAVESVGRVIDAEGAFGYGEGSRRILGAGPHGMLVDTGAAPRGLLDAVAQSSGSATRIAGDAIGQRGFQAERGLTSVFDRTLGVPRGITQMQDDINNAGRAVRGTAYAQAYGSAVNDAHPAYNDLELAFDRVPQAAIDSANKLIQSQFGSRNYPPMKMVVDPVTGLRRLENPPDVMQIDYVTRGLRQLAMAGEDAGVMGGRTPLSASYMATARDIRQAARQVAPEYGKALDSAADDISRQQAVQYGADLLKPGTTRSDAAIGYRDTITSEAERRDAMQGVRSYIDDLMANTRAIASDPNQDAREAFAALRVLGTRNAREKLQTLLTAEDAAAIQREVGYATRAAELYASQVRNSATFARGEAKSAVDAVMEPGVIGSAARGKFPTMFQRGIQTMFDTTPAADRAAREGVNADIARLLTSTRGQAAVDALDRLRGSFDAGPRNAALGQAVGNYAAPALGITGFQERNDILDMFGLGDARMVRR